METRWLSIFYVVKKLPAHMARRIRECFTPDTRMLNDKGEGKAESNWKITRKL